MYIQMYIVRLLGMNVCRYVHSSVGSTGKLYLNSPDGAVYVAVSSPPATEEFGGMGREIESRQGNCRVVALKNL
jgi:hypothetical protein